jgi:uncharacterized sporulation protein YeaH/YhbH (DUF444 family)
MQTLGAVTGRFLFVYRVNGLINIIVDPLHSFAGLGKIKDDKFRYYILKQKPDVIHALKTFFPKEKEG